jgi:hypothetical protein
MQRGRFNRSLDPRIPIAEAVAKSVAKIVPAEQAARYQKEVDERDRSRKQTVVLNLVAKMDRILVLTVEQREKLTKILEKNWKGSWELQTLVYGGQYFPQMPDAEITPLLTESQKTVWRGVQKGINFGFQAGMLPGLELGEEVWDNGPGDPAAAGKAVTGDKPAGKLVEKR